MAINANYLVSLTPRAITGGSSDLQTNGLVLTESELLPTNQPAMSFGSASGVASIFGAESAEAAFAQQYFTGIVNQQKSPSALVIGRLILKPVAAWLRSAPLTVKLADLQKVKDGALKLMVNGSVVTATGVDFSNATSFSQAAVLIAAKIEGVSGTYNSDLGSIILTTETTRDTATLDYAEVSESGTDLGTLLGFSKASGAVVSQGSQALTPAANMAAVADVTRNWSQFTTLTEITDEETAKAFAAWAATENEEYAFVFWSTDAKMTNVLTQKTTIAAALASYNTVLCLFGSVEYAAAVLAFPAVIKWDAEQGMSVLFGKRAVGLSANVTKQAVAEALDTLKVTYLGKFAARNSSYEMFNRGELQGTSFGFYDTIIGNIWLRSKMQRACLDGYASVLRTPYTESGKSLIEAWIADPIREAKKVGVIDDGVKLSEAQKAQITQEFGEDISGELFSNGYKLKIENAEANVRAKRESPPIYFYYCYGGSVQRLQIPVTLVS